MVVLFAGVLYGLRLYIGGGWCHSQARIDGKTVIVTGANTGIGKETALDLARRGGRIILACRSMQRGEEAVADIQQQLAMKANNNNVIAMKLDLSSLSSVREFVEEFKKNEKRLDILINNAGVAFVPESKTEDGFETTFGINHLGHFLLTNLLLDILKQSAPSRIVTVSSTGHHEFVSNGIQFDDIMLETKYSGEFAYGQSKLANILFTRYLANLLEGTGVTTYSLHPGVINTEIFRYLSPEKNPLSYFYVKVIGMLIFKDLTEGAQTQICCAIDPSLANETGKYYKDCVETEPSSAARDDETAKRLWDVSTKLVKL